MSRSIGVLFVCTGNICRSPTAQAVFTRFATVQGLAGQIRVDSAGTHDFNPGREPAAVAQRVAARRGYDLSDLRARMITDSDFATFDYILAMDDANHADLLWRCPTEHRAKLAMFLSFADGLDTGSVFDPYGGPEAGYETVLDLIEAGARGLLAHLRGRLPSG